MEYGLGAIFNDPIAQSLNDLIPRRRLIALLAVVPEAATLFSAVPHLPLSDVSHRVRQPYCSVYRADRGSAGNQPAARIPNWTIHSGRRSEGSSEKSRDADHGRVADCNRRRGAYAAVGGFERSEERRVGK